MAACSNPKAADPDIKEKTAAIASFRQQLDAIKRSGNDTTISIKTRDLYNTHVLIQNEVLPDALAALTNTLYAKTFADPGLLPFIRGLSTDSNLSPKNRIRVNLKLASYNAHITRDPDSAACYLNRIDPNSRLLDDSLKAGWYSVAAQLSQLYGQLKEASVYLYQCIAYYEKINDSNRVAGSCVNLANIYRELNDYPKAIATRKEALSYFLRQQDSTSVVIATGGLAADYLQVDQFDSARKYFLFTETLIAKGIRNTVVEYYLYLTKGGMYVALKDYDSSRYYFEKARGILPVFNDPVQDMLFVITSSVAYSDVRDVRKEARVIQAYIPELMEKEDLHGARDAYFCLYNISLVQKLDKEPIDYYLAYDSLKAVLAAMQNREYVAEMESKYESQKKNLKIQVQHKEIQQKNTLNVVLLLSLISAVLVGIMVLVRRQLLRSRRNAKLQQQFTRALLKNTEEERRRIAGELHDGISHELLALRNNLEQDTAHTEAKINAIIDDIRMISRNLHPVMLDQIGLTYSIRHLCEELMTGSELFVSAETDYREQLSPEDELQLYRIIQESLTNVVKYAHAHAAKISIVSESNRLLVTIMDNGKGFDVAERLRSKSAFGLHSLIERGKALGGKTTITSTGQGTVIHLEIPVNDGLRTHS